MRKYKPDPVPQEHLELILNTARLAPNSGNQQACRYLIIKNKERLDELKEACIRNRKTVLMVRGDEVPEEEAIRHHRYPVKLSYGVEYLVIQSEQTQLILSMFVLFIVSPAFVYRTIYPRYREIYPEATFFRNKVWILLALVTFILLILGVLYLTMTA